MVELFGVVRLSRSLRIRPSSSRLLFVVVVVPFLLFPFPATPPGWRRGQSRGRPDRTVDRILDVRPARGRRGGSGKTARRKSFLVVVFIVVVVNHWPVLQIGKSGAQF